MENEILKADSIEAINRSEVDIAIATAKQYPRDVIKATNEILSIAKNTKGTAEECFYSLPRREKQKDGTFKIKLIEGPSVRLAEIIAFAWGNINYGFRIVANDGKKITAQAVCHDLERNVRGQVEVDRRITTKDGRTFSDDMQIVTGNAAGSIALRNAILRVIPKAVIAGIVGEIKATAMGRIKDLETKRTEALTYFAKYDVTEKDVLDCLNLRKLEEIGVEEIFTLHGIRNGIEEGSIEPKDAFGLTPAQNASDKKVEEEIKKDLKSNEDLNKKENEGLFNNQKKQSNDKK